MHRIHPSEPVYKILICVVPMMIDGPPANQYDALIWVVCCVIYDRPPFFPKSAATGRAAAIHPPAGEPNPGILKREIQIGQTLHDAGTRMNL
jgi:hypothetical protein